MWTFAAQRQRKVWLWLAVERASRCVVAWVLDRRDAATARRLWHAMPPATTAIAGTSRTCFRLTWTCFRNGGTSIVKALNCSLRQRCGVLVRKSCSFSKSLAMHSTRIKIVIDNYNTTLL